MQKSCAPKGTTVEKIQGPIPSLMSARTLQSQSKYAKLPAVKSGSWPGSEGTSYSPQKSKLEVVHECDDYPAGEISGVENILPKGVFVWLFVTLKPPGTSTSTVRPRLSITERNNYPR